MIDVRPAGYIIGWLVGLLGLSMILPALVDLVDRNGNAAAFAASALVTITGGACIALACGGAAHRQMGLRQGFLLTTVTWVAFTGFATLPLMLGAPDLTYTDAFFETMSAMTTTGATVLVGIETLPRGVLLWRALLQWIGGIGVVVMAMVLLPVLKVGGMQLLRTSDFNTMGKIMPHAKDLAYGFAAVYLALTGACALAYAAADMSGFDAVTHAMTTIATGGMANYDSSFAGFTASAQYIATAFMLLGAMSFVRFLQMAQGKARPLFRDNQIRAFLLVYALFCALMLLARVLEGHALDELAFREVFFNVASLLSTTGYANTDYTLWGSLASGVVFCIGMVCGCSGSTSGGPKIFRYQVLVGAVASEVRRLHSPNTVQTMRFQGRVVSSDIVSSVAAFFMVFFLTLGLGAVALALVGLDAVTAISGAATCLSNVGPGLGPEIGPAGNFASQPDAAKWIMAFLMLAGRLELLTVYVLFTAGFWRH
jgi:trk system potassium uptake protein TrkH